MERRTRADRRVQDQPLPEQMEERRRSVERRLPEVEYIEIDEYIELSSGVATPISFH